MNESNITSCNYEINRQCMLQAGDNEDLTLDEFKEYCQYGHVCPISQYSKNFEGGKS